jgi:hypothetical protein
MTPTLLGRWQTRTFLLATAGNFISFFIGLIAWYLGSFVYDFFKPFLLLFLVWFFGLFWDALYNYLQTYRWDHDWPPMFQFLTGLIEMFPIYVIALVIKVPWWLFLLHYWLVWTVTFILSQGPMRILYPRWRFRGGQWLGGY